MVAARRVTQENQGKKTAGVAGVKAGGPLIRLLVVERLRHGEGIRAQPMHRVLIPTTGTPGEGRPWASRSCWIGHTRRSSPSLWSHKGTRASRRTATASARAWLPLPAAPALWPTGT